MIVVGSDHAGFKLKEEIIKYLKENNYEYLDCGTYSESSVDYPDIALKITNEITKKNADKGIIICGTGIGISIAANKIKGIRAALCTDTLMAKLSRQHNDSNVLAMGGRIIGLDLSLDIIETWLNTEFLGERHLNRVNKISNLETSNKNPSIDENKSDKIHILSHPLIQHKVSLLRDKNTHTKEFRELVSEVSMLIGYEVTRNMPLKQIEIETPVGIAKTKIISGKKLGFVPIIRAGLGMLDGVINLLPMAKVGHIGLYRDPDTLEAIKYYGKIPEDASERDIVILDPMLATGKTSSSAIEFLKEKGVKNLKLMCIIASKSGIKLINTNHPDVEIYTAAVDDELNDKAYIIPGLGDAGDRLYGTK
jgi:uracil phosphoribosyltransferase